MDLLRRMEHNVLWARSDLPGWQIAVQRPVPLPQAGVVLFRIHPATPEKLEPIVRKFLIAGRNWAGHISTISDQGI